MSTPWRGGSLTYFGGRAQGLRPDTLKLALGLDPNKYEDEYLKLTARIRDTYKTFMGNPELENDFELRETLAQRAAVAAQSAMAAGVISTKEYENMRFMMPEKRTFISLTQWLVRVRERREALGEYLGDALWGDLV